MNCLVGCEISEPVCHAWFAWCSAVLLHVNACVAGAQCALLQGWTVRLVNEGESANTVVLEEVSVEARGRHRCTARLLPP